jgi:Domain of unknown function (DUF4149)
VGQALFQRVAASVALLAAALWLGGLVALGAITAPIVFAVAPFPQSADAMTLVFRRFDLVAMSCAVLVLSGEAARAAGRSRALPFGRADWGRAGVCALAAAAAVVEGTLLSPRIAALHALGAIRGVGAAGTELSHLHDWAERCGKTQVALLTLLVVLSAWQRVPRVDDRSPGP